MNFEFKLVGSLDIDNNLSHIEKEKLLEDLLEKFISSTEIEVKNIESNITSKDDEEEEDCQACSGTGIGNPSFGTNCDCCGGNGYIKNKFPYYE
jgi:DnaJ-class molecular chaperone